MNIAILTARGGSKRIPRKNIRPFLGKPMIAWPIEAAKQSGLFDHIFVSTEDEEIAAISRQYGAEVPFLRPVELADDFTLAHIAAKNMLEWALTQWPNIPYFAHIYPTAPFLRAQDILKGYKKVRQGKNFVYTAQKLSFPVYQITTLNSQQEAVALFPTEKFVMRSQDMPQAFIDAGQLYWYNTKHFLTGNETPIPKHSGLIVIPSERALDIDTEEDWILAEQAAKNGLFNEPASN